jgi:hypothetical protein
MTATPAARVQATADAKNRFRRGTAFKETEKGPLYLEFAFNRIVALRPTPARAWVTGRDADSRWFSTIEPELDVSTLTREVRDVDAKLALGEEENENAVIRWRARNFRKFLAHVDSDVRALCAAGWQGRTWSFFRLLQAIPAAREIAMQPGGAHAVFALSRAHTILGGLASEQLPRAPRNAMGFARSWVKHSKKEILGRLGFPAQPAAVNVLAKVPRGDVDDRCLELLRDALHDPISFKRCCHAQRLPRSLVAVLATPAVRSRCGAQLLETLEHVDMEPMEVVRMVNDIVELANQLGAKAPLLLDLSHLFAEHDKLAAEARAKAKVPNIAFPAAPRVFSDDELLWVRQLMSPWELLKEGAEMHHCLGTLKDHVVDCASGDAFAFALEGEPRMSLLVRRVAPEKWVVVDLKRAANAPASRSAWRWAETLAARLANAHGAPTRSVEPPTEVPLW